MKKILFLASLVSLLFANQPNNTSTKSGIIQTIEANTAIVSQGNFSKGQSGIIVHESEQNTLILATAIVLNSDENTTKIEFFKEDMILQDAIPTTSLAVSKGDKVIFNHLYNNALIIAPNLEAKVFIQKNNKTKNFISEDLFATYLKLDNNPMPTKKDIQEFCKKNQIGLVYVVVYDVVFTLDVNTFTTLSTQKISSQSHEIKVPFFTRVEKIEKNFFLGVKTILKTTTNTIQIL